jgi:hypothetical protein
MTEPVVVTPVAAPINVDPVASGKAPAIAAAPAPAPAPVGEPSEKPSWLDARLERERAKVLKDLGIESLEDGKKAIGELNAKREAEKTSAQKAAELEGTLKSTKADKEAMAAALGGYAKTQLASLTDAQREAVAAIAGEDPVKQLKAIEALAPTWKAAAGTPATPSTPAAPGTPKPNDTAPGQSAPNDSNANTSPPDPKAIYAELKKTNPFIAARYALANGVHDTT